MNKPNKVITSLRLTPEAKTLLEKLSESLGLSQASVVELAVRDMAKAKNVK